VLYSDNVFKMVNVLPFWENVEQFNTINVNSAILKWLNPDFNTSKRLKEHEYHFLKRVENSPF
jgi:hypothetical protein